MSITVVRWSCYFFTSSTPSWPPCQCFRSFSFNSLLIIRGVCIRTDKEDEDPMNKKYLRKQCIGGKYIYRG